ncbi:hypothetical protein SpAn4DRAFT_2781 [Sporomusa ovata]|uniref:Uncharacterized protein n=1 Tax=Sporomusa ovata TaxID=2378 RepID=A0A0U1KY14_9FIRM|nr:hypothetical protein SpAn4DRAFT_2781 [Sporomusa ovata]
MLAVSLPETQSGVDELIIDVSYDSVFNVAQIEIINYGDTAQTLKEVHAHLRDYCIKKSDVIFLFLDMSKPLTAVLTERFE